MRCDIIMPVWNQLILTKDCLDSIKKNTDGEYGLIVIDNASNDETRKYLKELKASNSFQMTLIRNEENLGFVKAVNQGINASSAPLVCLLNNDTLVAKGWLGEMIAIANSSNDIGVVNPSSNNLGQRPEDGESFESYAKRLEPLSGQGVDLGSAIGFCMLIKRGLFNKIGLFDEIYGMGNFEDTDFSRKAVNTGFRCVRACGAYVYHRENSSFSKIKTFNADFERNKEIFEFRWGKPKRIAYILDKYDKSAIAGIEANCNRLVRTGNWVWLFSRGKLDIKEHSNIKTVIVSGKNFYAQVLWKILTKKKRFNEIYLGSEKLAMVLNATSFMHKAEIRYY